MTDPIDPASAEVPADSSIVYETIGTYTSYAEAQAAVDKLSDSGFPVASTRIVGLDVSIVETVTGRMTNGRAALVGAGGGAWFGLLLGLLFGLFTPGVAWILVVLAGVVFGAIWGAVFGFLAHWFTRGRRDFSSVKSLAAERYEVSVDRTRSREARRVLFGDGTYEAP